MSSPVPPAPAPSRHLLARRWHGAVPAATLLWRDILAFGTAINLLASFAALMLAAQGMATAWAVALHFAPLPWNLFLVLAYRRHAGRSGPGLALAIGWLLVMLVV